MFLPPSSSYDPSKGLGRGLQPQPAVAPTAAAWPQVDERFFLAPAHLLSLDCEQRALCKRSGSLGGPKLKLNHGNIRLHPHQPQLGKQGPGKTFLNGVD